MHINRINVITKSISDDILAISTLKHLKANKLKLPLHGIRSVKSFLVESDLTEKVLSRLGKDLLCDPITETFHINEYPEIEFDFAIEIGYRHGVTDNVATSTKEGIGDVLGRALTEKEKIFTSQLYFFQGKFEPEAVSELVYQYLVNPLIERHEIISREEWQIRQFNDLPPKAKYISAPDTVENHSLNLSDTELMDFSEKKTLSLSLAEMKEIRDHYGDDLVQSRRKSMGLPTNPTDVELEVLAQTWSEHCKHKIFAANIEYDDGDGNVELIHSLYKTYIQATTKALRKSRPDLLSVFSDNAGVWQYDDAHALCLKVETHNSPSALDPYGGAMTGIVGVNRDILGTGLGAQPIFNTDVFCFGPPDHKDELPEKLMHPKRIFEGVHKGVRDGGNESGIPTVNGAIHFEERFIGKPLVFCGTGGLMPLKVRGQNSYEKTIHLGDIIVMVGGRIGKDGIHGATFSSAAMTETSPTSAVQIGDPITQKKMSDFLLEARDLGYFRFITDNGAGGLSSSIGEMATNIGGCLIELDKAPLKYEGLMPWEILVSEAQERMSLAVPPEKWKELQELSLRRGVEVSAIGHFNDSGYFQAKYEDKLVCDLAMDFLHDGLPTMELKATWKEPQVESFNPVTVDDSVFNILKALLSRPNIASKEAWVRQYDHEVQARSVVKPFEGVKQDGPSDAAVIRPVYGKSGGLAIGCGLAYSYSDYDTYAMAQAAVDEAMRNVVSVGGNPNEAVALDNFCWPDPVQSENTPDGEYKLAQLVRCNQALKEICIKYNLPLISGKDSMKNDFRIEGRKISIPPTLLVTLAAPLQDVQQSVTSYFKSSGNKIALLGVTKDEFGGSEWVQHLGILAGKVPRADMDINITHYKKLHESITKGLIQSAHDCSEGGLAVALAEMCFGGELGCEVHLDALMNPDRLEQKGLLFSESLGRILLEYAVEDQDELKTHFGESFQVLGDVCDHPEITIHHDSERLSHPIDLLKKTWKEGIKL